MGMVATSSSTVEQPDSWERFKQQLAGLVANIGRVVVASDHTIRLSLLALFAEGHVLVEDLPGVGKTLLAKTIARSIGAKFTRIQFTPDLLPADITGTSIFDLAASRFEFVPGPVFANVVLADELNRAGPRTQSALLEAMGEGQVTVDGAAHPLPRPFMVIATQNLAESHGIFPLPNSQLDRFSIFMRLGFPNRSQELDILDRSEQRMPEVDPVLTPEAIVDMQATVRQVRAAQPVKEYILNILDGSRRHPAISLGASPRGGTFLQRCAQAWAAFAGRSFVVPEDVKDVAVQVLAHRVIPRAGEQAPASDAIDEVLDSVSVPM